MLSSTRYSEARLDQKRVLEEEFLLEEELAVEAVQRRRQAEERWAAQRQEVSAVSSSIKDAPALRRVRVGGADFDDVDMAGAVEQVVWMAKQKDRPRHVCTGNLDHLAMLQHDEEFRKAYQTADLTLADGMPVVWLSQLAARRNKAAEGDAAAPLRERVAGSDLFWELVQASHETGLRLFFLGGAPGSAEAAVRAAKERFPGVQICGTYCPSFEEWGTEAEEQRIEDILREAKPQVLLVGLGAPKQEKWILRTKERHGIPVSIGVGGTFEMAAGVVRRAPKWMQRAGLEWSYRLLQDPARLWQRYVCRDLPCFAQLVLATLGERGTKMVARPVREAAGR